MLPPGVGARVYGRSMSRAGVLPCSHTRVDAVRPAHPCVPCGGCGAFRRACRARCYSNRPLGLRQVTQRRAFRASRRVVPPAPCGRGSRGCVPMRIRAALRRRCVPSSVRAVHAATAACRPLVASGLFATRRAFRASKSVPPPLRSGESPGVPCEQECGAVRSALRCMPCMLDSNRPLGWRRVSQ